MHASTEQLLNLRDGVPVAADVAQHVTGCDECSDELDRLAEIRTGLRALPPVAAPAPSWNKVAAELDAPRLRRGHWVGLAAAIAVAGVITWAAVPRTQQGTGSEMPAVAAVEPQSVDLDTLVAESRQLEQLLRTLDRQSPHTMSASTAGTIAGLEDGIALIDYGLTYDQQMSGEASQRLWRQRVDLMNSLVQVRGAQLQRVSN